jgi:ABC-type antimicrobial peptide transport system permease subunit
MSVRRTKEVGIRKVLGASERSIVFLFSKEFTVLVCIAFLVAAPVAYYLMQQWLADFTFRIPLSAGLFVSAIVLSILIAWLTVAYKALKAAYANPVTSLRTE